jgi:hypothetical protein
VQESAPLQESVAHLQDSDAEDLGDGEQVWDPAEHVTGDSRTHLTPCLTCGPRTLQSKKMKQLSQEDENSDPAKAHSVADDSLVGLRVELHIGHCHLANTRAQNSW